MKELYAEEEEIHAEIDEGGWLAFENWLIRRMQESGNWIANTTPRTGDRGGDGIFIHREREQSVIIQAKHTQNTGSEMDRSAVQEVMNARDKYGLPDPLLVALTNASRFSGGAERLARDNAVILVDRSRLCLWPNHIVA
jgi:HJR/Mrr/RecB family endonuclease